MITQGYAWMLAKMYLKRPEGKMEADETGCEVSEPENSAQNKNKREDHRACRNESMVKRG